MQIKKEKQCQELVMNLKNLRSKIFNFKKKLIPPHPLTKLEIEVLPKLT